MSGSRRRIRARAASTVLLTLLLSPALAVAAQDPPSSSASASDGVPSAPRDPALAASDSALNLTWSPPENDNGSAVTNYLVYMGTEPQFLFLSGNTSDAWHNATGLQNGRRHYFAVTAVNADGEGPRSAQVSGIPRPPGLALGRVEIAPRLTTVQVGLKQRMIASVFDSGGWDVEDADVAWSVAGSIGTIDAGGNFTATSVGAGEIRVSATRGASEVNNSSALTVTARLFSIDGQVVDFYDQGVDNASVFLFDETTGKELEMVVTLDNGTFVFRVPNGQY
ncbi:MAG TPA: fibronectin type III domain-containing protein, partial [Thermoplasmata archaeon]|nr:fibronectin type III domain-containing protein [Thermoplasmata archaeon]